MHKLHTPRNTTYSINRTNGLPGGYWSQLDFDHVTGTSAFGPSTRWSWNVCRGLLETLGRLRWSRVPQKVTRSPAFTSTGIKPASNRSWLAGRPPSQSTWESLSSCRNINFAASSFFASKYSGFRMNWRLKLSRWEPGRTHRQPFSNVASSSANHRPRQDCLGVVCRNVESWCEWTVPVSERSE